MTRSTIAVIGAGITGVTTAYDLARSGLDVTLYDCHLFPAMETSFANGGQLSASNAEVWTHPATLIKGARWLLRPDAPLLMNLSPGWHKYSWLAEFIANVPSYRANTITTARLAVAARTRLREIAEREDITFDREDRGILHVYRNQRDMDYARRVSDLLAEGGVDRVELDPSGIAALEPTLHGEFVGGFHTPGDSTGDIHLFTSQLATVCRRYGVSVMTGTTVTGASIDADGVVLQLTGPNGTPSRAEHRAVVVCAGTGSRALARMFGDRINIYPVKGYSITVHLDDEASQQAAPWMSLLDDHAKIVTSRLGLGRFRVAGTAEFAGINRDIRAHRIAPLTDWVHRHFPGVSTRRTVPWAGLRPMTPSMMPRVGPGSKSGVFYNTGHGHLGWTLAAATSGIVTDAVHQWLKGSGAILARKKAV